LLSIQSADRHITLAATPSVGLSTWTKVSGPGAVTFLPNIINPNATVKVDSITAAWGLGNTYKLQWKEANWLCVDSSSVQITFYKRTSIANAGKILIQYTLLINIIHYMPKNHLPGQAFGV